MNESKINCPRCSKVGGLLMTESTGHYYFCTNCENASTRTEVFGYALAAEIVIRHNGIDFRERRGAKEDIQAESVSNLMHQIRMEGIIKKKQNKKERTMNSIVNKANAHRKKQLELKEETSKALVKSNQQDELINKTEEKDKKVLDEVDRLLDEIFSI